MSNISKYAEIGNNVNICKTTVVHDGVVIGDNTVIESYCIIGLPTGAPNIKSLKIGKNSKIRSHSVLYQGSMFGEDFRTGHHVLIREETIAGKSLRIGSYSELEGKTVIGNYVNIHSKVMVSQLTKIGDFVWIFPRTQTSTDPLPPSNSEMPITIKDMAVIAINSLILPGVTIGFGTYVSAGSVVKEDIPDGYCVTGNPAKPFTKIHRLIDFKNKLRHPWPLHNNLSNYPANAKNSLMKLNKELISVIKDE